jgi:hypothetical protein
MTEEVVDANAAQRRYWNTVAGPRWVAAPGFSSYFPPLGRLVGKVVMEIYYSPSSAEGAGKLSGAMGPLLCANPPNLSLLHNSENQGLNSAGPWSSRGFIEISYFNHNGSSGRLYRRG